MIIDLIIGLAIGIPIGFGVFYLLQYKIKKDGLYITFYWHRIRIELSMDDILEITSMGWNGIGDFMEKLTKRFIKPPQN
ncbi:MAG: hypothetical protein ACP5U0_07455 [Caldisphaera sp.]